MLFECIFVFGNLIHIYIIGKILRHGGDLFLNYDKNAVKGEEQSKYIEKLPENLLDYNSKFTGQLKLAKNKQSEENIHDLRVWNRRLTEFIKINSMLSGKNTRKTQDTLKKLLRSLGNLRDNQIQQIILAKYDPPKALIKSLKERENTLIKKARKNIESFDKKMLSKNVVNLATASRAKCRNKKAIGKNQKLLVKLVEGKFKTLKTQYEAINPTDYSTIHAVRIAFKKFRYTVEALSEFLVFSEENIKLLKEAQDLMGEIQDLVVLTGTIDGFVNSGELKLSGVAYQEIIIDKHMKIKEFYRRMPDLLDELSNTLTKSFESLKTDLSEKGKEDKSAKNTNKVKTKPVEKELKRLVKLIPDKITLSPDSAMKLYKDSQILKLLLILKMNRTEYKEASSLFNKHPDFLKLAGINRLPSSATLMKRAQQMNAPAYLDKLLKENKTAK